MRDGNWQSAASFLVRPALVARLDARDRALFAQYVLPATCPLGARVFWTTLTHLGGAALSIMAAILPLVTGWTSAVAASGHAAATLVLSHVFVQIVKRTIGRPRPSLGTSTTALATPPDRFSFPSGHAAAAMSVAFAYATAFPAVAILLIAIAGLVGMSRVFLGVHYPGDVLAGQAIAVVTAMVLG